jgi:hypothetical protein
MSQHKSFYELKPIILQMKAFLSLTSSPWEKNMQFSSKQSI